MHNASYRDTALHYCVDDLPGASLPGARLQKILASLGLGRPVTRLSLSYLQQEGLESLYRLATGALPFEQFRDLALVEQADRIEVATATRLAREAEERARETAMRARGAAMLAEMQRDRERAEAARAARERDPKYIARRKNQKLRAKYGIDTYVDQKCFGPLMKILKRVDAGQRISPEDFVWLSSVGEPYFSDELLTAYHRLEADFFATEFNRTGDPWMAVNASGHFRKCGRARDADSLLHPINVEKQKSSKLKSALCTTRGGVMRDLGHRDEAQRLGERAHALRADDYRPCTLLGAIHMESGNYSLGQEWYAKAVERGATVTKPAIKHPTHVRMLIQSSA